MIDAAAPPLALEEIVAAGRAAHPDVVVTAASLAPFVAPHLAGPVRHPADLYLAAACAAGNTAALARFDAAVLPGVDAPVARIHPDPAFRDEVRQAVRERLFMAAAGERPRVADYEGRGSLTAWVRVVGTRLALNMRRSTWREVPAGDDDIAARLVTTEGVALAGVRAGYAKQMQAALEASCRALSSRQRALLRMHVVDGLNGEQLAVVYGVNRSTISRWLAAAHDAAHAGMVQRMREAMGVDAAELTGLFALVRSQLDLRLSTALAASTRTFTASRS